MCVLTEGEDAVSWLNDTGYGHLASKIEGLTCCLLSLLLSFVRKFGLIHYSTFQIITFVFIWHGGSEQEVDKDLRSVHFIGGK